MNSITITGYVLDKPKYFKLDENQMQCLFFVSTNEPITNEVVKIPVKAIGDMADKCYANINVNTFVELAGTLYYKDKTMYAIPYSISFKQPKARTEMYLSSTEFIKTYAPVGIMKKLMGVVKKND